MNPAKRPRPLPVRMKIASVSGPAGGVISAAKQHADEYSCDEMPAGDSHTVDFNRTEGCSAAKADGAGH